MRGKHHVEDHSAPNSMYSEPLSIFPPLWKIFIQPIQWHIYAKLILGLYLIVLVWIYFKTEKS